MAEPAHAARMPPVEELRDAEQAPLDAADFPGCRAIRIAPEEIDDYEGRLEYWEAVRKLPLYEAWGFPEVWVDVPDGGSPCRPRSRRPGLTIHVREGGRLKLAESSLAFPGWTAEEIHRALNEHAMSAATAAALHRVGAGLAAAEGTGPDDDRWLRHYREEGRAAGRSEGRGGTKYEWVVAVLRERGIDTTAALPAGFARVGELPASALMRAALRCASESEFLELRAAECR